MNQRIIEKFYFSCLTIIICLSLFIGLVGEIKLVAASQPPSPRLQYTYSIANDRYGFSSSTFRWVYPSEGVLANDGITGPPFVLPPGFSLFVVAGPTYGTLGASPVGVLPSYGSGLQNNGSFTYRPNIGSTALKDQFTYYIQDVAHNQVSNIAAVLLTNSMTCTNDSKGANDYPNQKDLTQLCRDTYYEDTETDLAISWNWDETSMPGGNSADGCALFDNNANGMADFAVCMQWEKQIVGTTGYPVLYRCDADAKNDRCTGPTAFATPPLGLSCQVLQTNDDPFPTGDGPSPLDAKSICHIPFTVFETTIVNFLDVCSYPSAEPNSDPSDCVMKSSNNAVLKVIKNVEPNLAFGVTSWDIQILPLPLGLTNPVDTVYGDDETPSYVLSAGTYTISESSSANNPIGFSNPTTKYQCKNIRVTPVVYDPVLPQTLGPTRSFSRAVVAGDIWECTFTNTFNPTAVSLLSFESKVVSEGILLTWETAEETDNLGFNLYRSSSPDGAKVPVNTELIPTKTYPGSTFGAVYDYLDTNVVSGVTYHYWLEDVSLDGNQVNSVHETSNQPRWLYIPTMSR